MRNSDEKLDAAFIISATRRAGPARPPDGMKPFLDFCGHTM